MPPILCPNCRRLISSDEPVCPYCRLRNPGRRWKQALGSWLSVEPQTLIRAIITVCVVMFGLSVALDPMRGGHGMNPLALLTPSDRSLLLLGATGTVPVFRLHRWWSLLAANYLHGGILHLFFNMVALAQIGPFVAREYGASRLLVIYTVGGVAGFLVSVVAGVGFTIGASAAILALIGAAMYYGKSRGGGYGQAVFRQLWGWTVGIFVFGMLFPGINNWAHGGGLAAGFVLGHLLGYRERTREGPVHRLLAVVCVVATGAALAWGVGGALLWRMGG